MKKKVTATRTTARAQLPKVRTSCALDEMSDYGDDLPHLVGAIESTLTSSGQRFTASVNLLFGVKDSRPRLYLNGRQGKVAVATIEDCVGDEATLSALILLLTALRDGLQREEPAMRAKVRAFDSFVRLHRAPRRRPA